ncbi:MAG: tetratricopeptide repeat protein, partial [Deltaproteobacteria bacterium]|nr:tetratricopeptide repeat protein [Deltaproteobacteria bacterium]
MKNKFSIRVVNHLLFVSMLIGFVTLFSFNLAAFDLLHSENGNTKKGNSFLDTGKNEKALTMYNKAAKELPDNGKVHLNRGLALLRSGDDKLDEAMQALTLATNSDSDNDVLARANYNLGNAFFKKEDYDEAIKHYKKSLMLSPGNKDAAWNLEVARLNKKKKEEEQKKKQDQEKQNQDQDKQDQDKQDQDKQDQDKQDQDKQDQD